MDDWEQDDFEPSAPAGKAATDKWEGEDEDDVVKDNWDDEDEENKPSTGGKETAKPTAYQRPKKKPLAERIADKIRAKQEAAVEKKELTPEEKLIEKIRVQKSQEEADLKLAKGLFSVGDSQAKGIDAMLPETKEQFDEFAEALKTKITFFESSKLYGDFVEKLVNDISLSLPAEHLKRLGIALTSLYHEQERQRKKQAKGKKKKHWVTVHVEKEGDLSFADEASRGGYFDDDHDFM